MQKWLIEPTILGSRVREPESPSLSHVTRSFTGRRWEARGRFDERVAVTLAQRYTHAGIIARSPRGAGR
jgi:hypothetical protein